MSFEGFQRVADPLVRLERVSKGKTVAAEGCSFALVVVVRGNFYITRVNSFSLRSFPSFWRQKDGALRHEHMSLKRQIQLSVINVVEYNISESV